MARDRLGRFIATPPMPPSIGQIFVLLIRWFGCLNAWAKIAVVLIGLITVSVTSIMGTLGLSQVENIPTVGADIGVDNPIKADLPKSPEYGEVPCPAGYDILPAPTGSAAITDVGKALTLCRQGDLRLILLEALDGKSRQWVEFNIRTGVDTPRPDLR